MDVERVPKRQCVNGAGAGSPAQGRRWDGPVARVLPTRDALNTILLKRTDVSSLFTTAWQLAELGFPINPDNALRGALVAVSSGGNCVVRRIFTAGSSATVQVEGRTAGCPGDTHSLSCLMDAELSGEQWNEVVAEVAGLMLQGLARPLTGKEVYYTSQRLVQLNMCMEALRRHQARQQQQQQQPDCDALRDELYEVLSSQVWRDAAWDSWRRHMLPWSTEGAAQLAAGGLGAAPAGVEAPSPPAVQAAWAPPPPPQQQLQQQHSCPVHVGSHQQYAGPSQLPPNLLGPQHAARQAALRTGAESDADAAAAAQRQAALCGATAALLQYLASVGVPGLLPGFREMLEGLSTDRLLFIAANGAEGAIAQLQRDGLLGASPAQAQGQGQDQAQVQPQAVAQEAAQVQSTTQGQAEAQAQGQAQPHGHATAQAQEEVQVRSQSQPQLPDPGQGLAQAQWQAHAPGQVQPQTPAQTLAPGQAPANEQVRAQEPAQGQGFPLQQDPLQRRPMAEQAQLCPEHSPLQVNLEPLENVAACGLQAAGAGQDNAAAHAQAQPTEGQTLTLAHAQAPAPQATGLDSPEAVNPGAHGTTPVQPVLLGAVPFSGTDLPAAPTCAARAEAASGPAAGPHAARAGWRPASRLPSHLQPQQRHQVPSAEPRVADVAACGPSGGVPGPSKFAAPVPVPVPAVAVKQEPGVEGVADAPVFAGAVAPAAPLAQEAAAAGPSTSSVPAAAPPLGDAAATAFAPLVAAAPRARDPAPSSAASGPQLGYQGGCLGGDPVRAATDSGTAANLSDARERSPTIGLGALPDGVQAAYDGTAGQGAPQGAATSQPVPVIKQEDAADAAAGGTAAATQSAAEHASQEADPQEQGSREEGALEAPRAAQDPAAGAAAGVADQEPASAAAASSVHSGPLNGSAAGPPRCAPSAATGDEARRVGAIAASGEPEAQVPDGAAQGTAAVKLERDMSAGSGPGAQAAATGAEAAVAAPIREVAAGPPPGLPAQPAAHPEPASESAVEPKPEPVAESEVETKAESAAEGQVGPATAAATAYAVEIAEPQPVADPATTQPGLPATPAAPAAAAVTEDAAAAAANQSAPSGTELAPDLEKAAAANQSADNSTELRTAAGAAPARVGLAPAPAQSPASGAKYWLTREPAFMEYWLYNRLTEETAAAGPAPVPGFRINRPTWQTAVLAPAIQPADRPPMEQIIGGPAPRRHAVAPQPACAAGLHAASTEGRSGASIDAPDAATAAVAAAVPKPAGSSLSGAEHWLTREPAFKDYWVYTPVTWEPEAPSCKTDAAGSAAAAAAAAPAPVSPWSSHSQAGNAKEGGGETPATELSAALSEVLRELVRHYQAACEAADKAGAPAEGEEEEDEEGAGPHGASGGAGGAGGKGRPPKRAEKTAGERKWASAVAAFLAKQPEGKATYGDVRRPPCSRGVPHSIVPRGKKGPLIRYLHGFRRYFRVIEVLNNDELCVLEVVRDEDELSYKRRLYDYLREHPAGVSLAQLVRSPVRIPKNVLQGCRPTHWLREQDEHFTLESGDDGAGLLRALPDARP